MDEDRRPAIGDFRFFHKFDKKDDKGEPVSEEWVDWLKLGDAHGARTHEKIARLRGHDGADGRKPRDPSPLWEFIEPAYQAWKQGLDMPVDGTPLEAWAGITPDLLDVLKQKKIRTVEEFAKLPDSFITNIPIPDIRGRQQAAKLYLESRKSTAEVEEKLVSRDKQIDHLTSEIEELKALLRQVSPDDAPKRKPGRPRKEEAA